VKYACGLDLSLRSAGLALVPTDWAPALDWRRVIVRTVGLKLTKESAEREHGHRIAAMSRAILEFIQGYDVEHVFLEGYAYSQMLSRAHSLGEIGGAVKLRLYDAGYSWTTVAASSARAHLGCFSARAPKGAPKLPKVKEQVHAALRAMGAPADWTGDELDALVVANHALVQGGHGGILVPREPKPKRGRAA
jgi:Holliday junction resolvasome RuvABC endonuclease subunit